MTHSPLAKAVGDRAIVRNTWTNPMPPDIPPIPPSHEQAEPLIPTRPAPAPNQQSTITSMQPALVIPAPRLKRSKSFGQMARDIVNGQ